MGDGARMEVSNLHIGPRALDYRRVEQLEEVLHVGAAKRRGIWAEECRGEGRFGDCELGGRHDGAIAGVAAGFWVRRTGR